MASKAMHCLTVMVFLVLASPSLAAKRGGCVADMFRVAGVSSDAAVTYETNLGIRHFGVAHFKDQLPFILQLFGVRRLLDANRFHTCHAKETRNKASSQCKSFQECTNRGKCGLQKSKESVYSCRCKAGYYGSRCQLDACHNKCHNGGKCTRLAGGKRFRCTCKRGFTGQVCQGHINRCKPNPCANHGQCRSLINDFVCTCRLGYSGKRCQNAWLTEKQLDKKFKSVGAQHNKQTSEVKDFRKDVRNTLAALTANVKALARMVAHQLIHGPPSCVTWSGKPSGIYRVYIQDHTFQAFCDKTTDGGGWTVIQRRKDGSVDFLRGWNDYKNGFGSLKGNLWLGLEKMYWMTSSAKYELRIDMVFKDSGKKQIARYSSFRLGNEADRYRLHISGYSSPTGVRDSFAHQNNQQFTTKDKPDSYNCATKYPSGWWFNHCGYSANLNNNRYGYPTNSHKGMEWYDAGYFQAVSFSEMKIRRL